MSEENEPRTVEKRELIYSVGSGIKIACDAWGSAGDPPVILMHGGGQTRYAWGGTAESLAKAGFYALSIDLRGHGESDWSPNGDYKAESYVEDLHGIIQTLDRPPALVGASLGGQTVMLSQGELHPGTASAAILVDITPRVERTGIERIVAFMTAAPDGFASLDEAADAVAKFLPNRPRPTDTSGLEKNLRLGDDGRWRWHWDPRFLLRASKPGPDARAAWTDRLVQAASRFDLPTLLVRGRMSDVVSEENAQDFMELVPHASFVDVEDAAHMVAGDKNDVFSDSIIEFLRTVRTDLDSSAA